MGRKYLESAVAFMSTIQLKSCGLSLYFFENGWADMLVNAMVCVALHNNQHSRSTTKNWHIWQWPRKAHGAASAVIANCNPLM
jgi:hypothetical protein